MRDFYFIDPLVEAGVMVAYDAPALECEGSLLVFRVNERIDVLLNPRLSQDVAPLILGPPNFLPAPGLCAGSRPP